MMIVAPSTAVRPATALTASSSASCQRAIVVSLGGDARDELGQLGERRATTA